MTAGMTFVMVIIVLLHSSLKSAKKCKKIREKLPNGAMRKCLIKRVDFSLCLNRCNHSKQQHLILWTFPQIFTWNQFHDFLPNFEHYVDVSRVTYLVHDVVVGENYFYHLGLEVWVVYGGIQHNPHQVGAVGVAVDPHSTPAYFQ